MEQIIIIPKNEKQSSIIKAFLEEMKIHFKTGQDNSQMSEDEFYVKIDKAKQQVREGKGRLIKNKEELDAYLNSL